MNQTGSIKKICLQIIICLIIFGGGLHLLSLRIPGWSLFLGLPTTGIGIIFLIFTLDSVARKKLGTESLQVVLCSVCGRPTPAPSWQNEKICLVCEEKLKAKLKEEKKVK